MRKHLEMFILVVCVLVLIVGCLSGTENENVCANGLYYVDGECKCLNGKNIYGGNCYDGTETDGDTAADGDSDVEDEAVADGDEDEVVSGETGLWGDMSGYYPDSPKPIMGVWNSGNYITRYDMPLTDKFTTKERWHRYPYSDYVVGKDGNFYYRQGMAFSQSGELLNSLNIYFDNMSVNKDGNIVGVDHYDDTVIKYDVDTDDIISYVQIDDIYHGKTFLDSDSNVVYRAKYDHVGRVNVDTKEIVSEEYSNGSYGDPVEALSLTFLGKSQLVYYTWENIIRINYADMTRAQKLAYFGWKPSFVSLEGVGIFFAYYKTDSIRIGLQKENSNEAVTFVSIKDEELTIALSVSNNYLYVRNGGKLYKVDRDNTESVDSIECDQYLVSPNDMVLCSEGVGKYYYIRLYDKDYNELWSVQKTYQPYVRYATVYENGQIFIPCYVDDYNDIMLILTPDTSDETESE